MTPQASAKEASEERQPTENFPAPSSATVWDPPSRLSSECFPVLCGFCPKLAALIQIMPQSVLGGAAVIMFASIVVSGIQLITSNGVTNRVVTIVAVSLGLGYGLGTTSNVLAMLPKWVTYVFGGSGIVPAGVCAIILNAVLKPDDVTSSR